MYLSVWKLFGYLRLMEKFIPLKFISVLKIECDFCLRKFVLIKNRNRINMSWPLFLLDKTLLPWLHTRITKNIWDCSDQISDQWNKNIFVLFVWLLFGGHTPRYSGFTPCLTLREKNQSWQRAQCSENDMLCKGSNSTQSVKGKHIVLWIITPIPEIRIFYG